MTNTSNSPFPRSLIILLTATATAMALTLPALAQPNSSDAALQAAIEAVLKSKPELVRDAMNELARREVAAQQRKSSEILKAAQSALISENGATVLGNPMGDVTLVEFSDYRCGYCRKMAPGLIALIRADPQLRVVVKHLPVLGEESVAAAQMVLALGQGAAAGRLHDALFEASSIDKAGLARLPGARVLNNNELATINGLLLHNQHLAERLEIQGTPALIVGEMIFRGAVDLSQLAEAIRNERARRAAVPAAKS